jgi:hypothetical protein
MDCPSEENMIRLKSDGIQDLQKLKFDLETRRLVIYHSADNPEIAEVQPIYRTTTDLFLVDL